MHCRQTGKGRRLRSGRTLLPGNYPSLTTPSVEIDVNDARSVLSSRLLSAKLKRQLRTSTSEDQTMGGIMKTSIDEVNRLVACAGFALFIGISTGSPPATAASRIETLYSDQSGSFQYIELRENSMDGHVGSVAGSVITVKRGSVVKQYVIPTDPPTAFPAGGSLIISSADDWSGDDVGPVPPLPPDYVMPERFLPTDGGTIDLDGQDPWEFDALSIDGSTALSRSRGMVRASGRSFALGSFNVHVDFTSVGEYYNSSLGHYFYTGSEPDLDAIGSGRIKGWESTRHVVGGFTVPIPTHCCSTYGQIAVPVCRFYIPPEAGDSHFYSAFADECDDVAAKFPSFVLETKAAFYVYLPDIESGVCPFGRPVYRLWNQRASTNHRYILDDLALRMSMIQQGWMPEGRGPAGVAWCY